MNEIEPVIINICKNQASDPDNIQEEANQNLNEAQKKLSNCQLKGNQPNILVNNITIKKVEQNFCSAERIEIKNIRKESSECPENKNLNKDEEQKEDKKEDNKKSDEDNNANKNNMNINNNNNNNNNNNKDTHKKKLRVQGTKAPPALLKKKKEREKKSSGGGVLFCCIPFKKK